MGWSYEEKSRSSASIFAAASCLFVFALRNDRIDDGDYKKRNHIPHKTKNVSSRLNISCWLTWVISGESMICGL